MNLMVMKCPKSTKLANRTVLDGKVLIEDVNDLFGLDIDHSEMDTIGGWIMSEKIDIAQGDKIHYHEYEFTILEVDGYHIKSLEIVKLQESIA